MMLVRPRAAARLLVKVFLVVSLLVCLDLWRDHSYLFKYLPILDRFLPTNFATPDGASIRVSRYLHAIFDPADNTFLRVTCPAISPSRYGYLSIPKPTHGAQHTYKYLIALNLFQSTHILPRLMSSIVEAARFLGPHNVMISIVEGHSTDGTQRILSALQPRMDALGISYIFRRSPVTPAHGDRIGKLAQLRNLALDPLTSHPELFAPDAAIAFLNDVAICAEDILELLHQQRLQNATMTCAVDWGHNTREPTFYDVWVARGIDGDSLFRIPLDGSWLHAQELFPNHTQSRELWAAKKPLPVFACWNGAVVMAAKPFADGTITFRKSADPECMMGEPTLLCKDMWYAGIGKVAMIPAVNLEYDDIYGQQIKEKKGYTSEIIKDEDPEYRIKWPGPPKEVLCMPDWTEQTWKPWDEGLPLERRPNKDSDKQTE